MNLFKDGAANTLKERYLDPSKAPRVTSANVCIDPRTVASTVLREPNLFFRAGQALTDTRAENEMDLRMAYLQACGVRILAKTLSASNKVNGDCTTYAAINDGSGEKFLVVREEGEIKQVIVYLY